MLLVVDNYDSFTFNLVQYLGELGADPAVFRNDRITVAEALARRPQAIVISPGPKTPAEAGISVALLRDAVPAGIPVLGVCLGHQALGEAFGAVVVRADRQMHGKTTAVIHNGDELFAGIQSPVTVMRYHSLIVAADGLPADFEVIAWSADRAAGAEVMAIRHRRHPAWGVQFHPESIGTDAGKRLLTNFLHLAGVVP